MDLYARARTGLLSWTQGTPLPQLDSQTIPVFQAWHSFDSDRQQWGPTNTNNHETEAPKNEAPRSLTLMTWNIGAFASRTEDRVTGVLDCVHGVDSKVDILFLQEVSRPALLKILKDERIRESWVSSECDDRVWGKQSFATMTLLSRRTFAAGADTALSHPRQGPVWRVPLPSRFDRDALCCDIFISQTRLRLINVHLDSLPIKPSHRPQQMSIISEYIRSAGQGVVAGDFNPVLDEDATLVEDNGLMDIWTKLQPGKPGFTWGIDGEQPFSACRLDKVTFAGVRPLEIDIVEAKRVDEVEGQNEDLGKNPLWSDHHALLCSFGLLEAEDLADEKRGYR